MTSPQPHWTRIPDTASPLRCNVTVGLEHASDERGWTADTAVNGSKAGAPEPRGRTFKPSGEKPDSLEDEDGNARGTKRSDMSIRLALMFWWIGRLTTL